MSVEGVVQRRNFFNWILMWAAALFGVPIFGFILIFAGGSADSGALALLGVLIIPVGYVASAVILLLYNFLRAQDFATYLSGTQDSILVVSPWWAILSSWIYSLFYSGRFREHLRRQGNPMAERFPDPLTWWGVTILLIVLSIFFFWVLLIPVIALVIWIMFQEYRLHSAFYDLAAPLA